MAFIFDQSKRSRWRREEKEANIEYLDAEYEDTDGDGTLDWHPAVGSYVPSKQLGRCKA
jgi:hypothetical protein